MKPLDLARRLYRWAKHQHQLAKAKQIKRQLVRQPNRQYSADWFSEHIPNWETHLLGLRGQEHLSALEVGSFEGRSAVWLLENILTHPTARLTCIDPFLAHIEVRFDHNLALCPRPEQLRKCKGYSEDVLPTLAGEQFDLIYIDGSHQAVHVLFDAVLAWGLLKKGGVLIFDDYQWARPTDPRASQRPKMAIDVFLETHAKELESLHMGWQVMVRKI
jgi:predicted O-methyltransferase YrrM